MQSLCASVLDILNNALASLMLGESLLNAKYVESKVHLKPKQVQTWATHRDFRSACSLSLWGVVCVSNEENKQRCLRKVGINNWNHNCNIFSLWSRLSAVQCPMCCQEAHNLWQEWFPRLCDYMINEFLSYLASQHLVSPEITLTTVWSSSSSNCQDCQQGEGVSENVNLLPVTLSCNH